jgi:hypothetical protein
VAVKKRGGGNDADRMLGLVGLCVHHR